MKSQIELSFDELLLQATCAILIDDQVKGTAWLASNEGHLITAGHILDRETPAETVEIRFPGDIPRRAHKLNWVYQPTVGIDCAILKIENWQANRQPLPMVLSREVTGEFTLRGYGITLRDQSGGKGKFLGPFDPQDSQDNRMFALRSSEIGQGGYSGAAVFSEKLGAVVAIQVEATTASTGPHRDTILAMPLYRVVHHWSKLNELARARYLHNDSDDMDYEYDIVLSYVDGFSGPWIRETFHKHLEHFLEDSLGQPVVIEPIVHSSPQTGDCPPHLKYLLTKSRCLIPIWSPSYFNSSWCLYESYAMLKRETVSGYGTIENPTRLIIPVLGADGAGFPPFTREFTNQFDCRDYIAPPQVGWRNTDSYFTFYNEMKEWVWYVAESIARPPSFQEEWLNLGVEIPQNVRPKCKKPAIAVRYQKWVRS